MLHIDHMMLTNFLHYVCRQWNVCNAERLSWATRLFDDIVNITLSRSHFLIYVRGNALWVRSEFGACAVQFTVRSRQKMASAKFLEEALSTDVDESAVNAIVGTLETQLVTTAPAVSSQQVPSATVNQNHMNSAIANGGTVSTQKHGVTNGGSGSVNIILSSDTNKTNTTSTIQSGNVVHSNVVNTVVASLHGAVPASGYINQVTSSATQSSLTNLTKSHEAVKIVYPAGSQTLTTAGGVNINSRLAFPAGALPNGNLGLAPLSSHTVLNAVTSSVQSVVSQTHSQAGSNVTKQIGGVIGIEHGKPSGTALVIKTSVGNPNVAQGTPLGAGVVSVPVTVNTTMTLTGTHVNTAVGATTTSGMSGVVTLAKPITHTVGTPQTIVGSPSTTILPANVQIVNVNTVRPAAPAQPGQKGLTPRVVIGTQHMVGARPGQPGVSLHSVLDYFCVMNLGSDCAVGL